MRRRIQAPLVGSCRFSPRTSRCTCVCAAEFFSVRDRYRPARVWFVCACACASHETPNLTVETRSGVVVRRRVELWLGHVDVLCGSASAWSSLSVFCMPVLVSISPPYCIAICHWMLLYLPLMLSSRNIVTRAGKSMRNNVAKEGAKIIGDANSLLGGLCTQVGSIYLYFCYIWMRPVHQTCVHW